MPHRYTWHNAKQLCLPDDRLSSQQSVADLGLLIGAGVGAAAGYLGHLAFGPSSDAPKANTKVAEAPDMEFDSAKEAAEWASSRYYDAGQAQGVEYGGYIHKLDNGKYVLDDIYVGEAHSVQLGTSREVFAGDEIHAWHTHPTDEAFSEGTFIPGGENDPASGYVLRDDYGDYAATLERAKYFENDATRTYMLSPSRNLRSIGVNGPMDFGVSHGTVSIPRVAPAVGGAIGGAVATPVVRAWFTESRLEGRR